MYKASIQNQEFDINLDQEVFINGLPHDVEFEQIGFHSFKLHFNGEEHIADLVSYDTLKKEMVLRMKSKKLSVQLKEPVDLFLEKIGIRLPEHKKENKLVAPMPGLVLKILVQPGDQVKKGEPLLVLEAMKMENVFKASDDVTIKEINVVEKQAVEKGNELINFE
ncbi:MAG: biotin/lipoyl-binding protein [Chitinophagaceae bacterium]|nr:biotin/lipoyl-binding protein [Chitinophagaceae bacterium]